MDVKMRTVTFELNNVAMTSVGPLKDETAFKGKIIIVEEPHGAGIEWHPLKVKIDDSKTNSPEIENLDWEDVSSSVGFKANHNDSIDAVEIKAIRIPNVLRFDIADIKSYKRSDISDGHETIRFLLKDGTNIPSLQFETCDFVKFCEALDSYIIFKRSKKEGNLYLVVDPKVEALEKSFSELDLFTDSKSTIIHKIIQDPYTTAMGGFSKVTNFLFDYMVYSNGHDLMPPGCSDADISEMISGNIINVDIDHHEEPGYEFITCVELSPRPAVVREEPVTQEEWLSYIDLEGRMKDVEKLKSRIFRGGLVPSIRSEAWKYLLNFFEFEACSKDKVTIQEQKSEAYFRMKLQWKSFTVDQESRFSALRDRKSLIEKDVSRTDRTHPYFEGEHNLNLQMLQDILMTYCMFNFDLGYVQGMSDLLSPILVIMQDEVDAFWCFAGWLKDIGSNFELEQQGMKTQLQDLHRLLHFVDTQLCNYLEKHDSGNMYFAFRWLLILFKRDFKFNEIMRLWEVLWTGLPCKNFHLLICIAILDSEKMTIMENGYGLTEILKHVNEMSYKINLDETLSKAEAIYLQVKNSKRRSDVVETILGLEHVESEELSRISLKPTANIKNGSVVFESSHSSSANIGAENIDEYVDLEHNPLLFELPY